MRHPVFFAVLLVAAAFAPVGVVSAQEDGNVSVDVGGDDRTNCTEHIGEHVSLCSATVDDGRVELELISDQMMIVTITDAGGIMEGGEIKRADVRLRTDRRTTFEMEVTESDGFVGVTIDTGTTLYGKVIEEQTSPFLARPTKADSLLIGLTVFGLFAVSLPVSWVAIKRRDGGEKDVF